MTIAAMKQALECLESLAAEPPGVRALHPDAVVIQNLRAAISEQEKAEPVAAEQVQWRNITHVVRTLADWAFESKDHPTYGSCWIAMVNGLTAKDGPEFHLPKLPIHPAPVPAGMVKCEPPTHEGRPYKEWYSRKISEVGDPPDMPSGALHHPAPVPAGWQLVPMGLPDDVNMSLNNKYGYPPYGWKATYKYILSALAAAPKEKS